MSTRFVGSSVAFLLVLIFTAGQGFTNRGGAPAARSGGAGEQTCATSSCHTGTANSGPGLVSLASDAPSGVYTPGDTYTITATVEQSGISRFGFEVLSGYNSVLNASVGTTSILAAGETKLLSFGARRYVTQVTGGSTGSNTRSWSFSWTAPNPGVGNVSFFMAGNAANNNANRSGDQIYTTSLSLVEAAVSIESAFLATSIEVFPSLAQDNINLVVTDAGLEPLLAQVIDQNGRVVLSQELVPAGSELRRVIPLDHLATGLYYLRVTGEQFSDTKKFVKF